jgi:hypothetical protein
MGRFQHGKLEKNSSNIPVPALVQNSTTKNYIVQLRQAASIGAVNAITLTLTLPFETC